MEAVEVVSAATPYLNEWRSLTQLIRQRPTDSNDSNELQEIYGNAYAVVDLINLSVEKGGMTLKEFVPDEDERKRLVEDAQKIGLICPL